MKKSMWRKKLILLFLVVSMALASVGCGIDKKAEEAYTSGMEQLSEEQYKKAEKTLKKAVLKEEGKKEEVFNKKVYQALGVACLRQQKYKAAADYFEQALELDCLEEYNGDLYAYRSEALIAQENYEAALEDLKLAREEKKKDMDLLLKEYYLLSELGEESDAEALLNEGIDIKGSGDRFDYQKSRLYYYLGNLAKAKEGMEKAADQEIPGAYLYLGMISEKEEDWEAALSRYEAGRKLWKKEGQVPDYLYLRLVRAYMQSGAADKAWKRLEEAREQGDGTLSAELTKDAISVLESMTDFDEAYRMCREYLQENPEDAEVLRESEFLETRIEQ